MRARVFNAMCDDKSILRVRDASFDRPRKVSDVVFFRAGIAIATPRLDEIVFAEIACNLEEKKFDEVPGG